MGESMRLGAVLIGVAMDAAALIGVVWVQRRRRRYRHGGCALNAAERRVLSPYFDSSLLDRVRVCRVKRIEAGLPRWLMRSLKLPGSADISAAAGMAFGDAVVIAEIDAKRTRPMSLLFHELVHCEQYRVLGILGFLRRYLRGWAKSGFEYRAIALEEQAYELQDRFDSGEVFRADSEVAIGLRFLKYL